MVLFRQDQVEKYKHIYDDFPEDLEKQETSVSIYSVSYKKLSNIDKSKILINKLLKKELINLKINNIKLSYKTFIFLAKILRNKTLWSVAKEYDNNQNDYFFAVKYKNISILYKDRFKKRYEGFYSYAEYIHFIDIKINEEHVIFDNFQNKVFNFLLKRIIKFHLNKEALISHIRLLEEQNNTLKNIDFNQMF